MGKKVSFGHSRLYDRYYFQGCCHQGCSEVTNNGYDQAAKSPQRQRIVLLWALLVTGAEKLLKQSCVCRKMPVCVKLSFERSLRFLLLLLSLLIVLAPLRRVYAASGVVLSRGRWLQFCRAAVLLAK